MLNTFAYYSSAFYRNFTAYTSEKLEALGLHYGLLFFVLYVGKHPGTTPSELTRALRADWGHSQRSITKLVEDGFMTKEKSGRVYHLNLTDKGMQAFAVSHQVFTDWDNEKLAVLTEEERAALFMILQKITRKGEKMRTISKIWLWAALILCICTTAMNAMMGRGLSVVIAVVSIIGLGILLFKEKKMGFNIMCICAAASFLVGVTQSIQGGTGAVISIVMSLIGSAMVPGITWLFIRSEWGKLK